MPRYDYDDQDEDYDDHEDAHPWRQRLITWALAALGLGLGFLIPYTLYLNHQVSQRFGALQWQIPTRVYARPLQLAPGVAMDAQTLKTELDAASYRDDGAGDVSAPTPEKAAVSPFRAAASPMWTPRYLPAGCRFRCPVGASPACVIWSVSKT